MFSALIWSFSISFSSLDISRSVLGCFSFSFKLSISSLADISASCIACISGVFVGLPSLAACIAAFIPLGTCSNSLILAFISCSVLGSTLVSTSTCSSTFTSALGAGAGVTSISASTFVPSPNISAYAGAFAIIFWASFFVSTVTISPVTLLRTAHLLLSSTGPNSNPFRLSIISKSLDHVLLLVLFIS